MKAEKPKKYSFGRIASAGVGAAIFGSVAAALEAHAAVKASGASFATMLAVALGLLAPLGLLLGVLIGSARALFVPPRFGAALFEYLAPGLRRTQRSVAFLLAPPAFLLFLLVTARWGLFVLSSGLPDRPAGAALALGAVLLGAGLTFAIALAARAAAERRLELPAPGASLGVSFAASAAIVALLIAFGETSGGSSVWTEFGVLRREELNLKPVALLALIAIGAATAPILRSLPAALVGAVLALVPLGFTAFAARGGLEAPGVALAIERHAELSAKVLGRLRHLADGDRDGFSARFGGGDCDDDDPEKNPEALDLPGNGRDEDCSGADTAALPAHPRAEPKALGGADARAKLPPKLNVVLITIDTLRWDLGYTGYPRPITPNIDGLVKQSVLFERAYALASYTAKSLPPMLIGKYAGETARGYQHFNRFEKTETFVAERLQRAGIHTVSVQGHWYFFQPPFGMERGFDLINASAAPRAPQLEGDRGSTSERLSDAVIAELGGARLATDRFFLWAHYTDPHAEYVTHEGFDFGNESRARYDSEVAYVDQQLGRVLEALEKSPFRDRTALVLTSDHGEAFGEHGMIRHGFELWEELVRVPLIVRLPGFAPRRVSARRSLIDLVPTLLDLFGLPPPSGEGTDFVSGRSLLEDLVAETPAVRPIFVDMSEGPHNKERRAYIEDDMKLVTSYGRPLSLFDLRSDAREERELSSDRERLKAELERYKRFQATLREVKVRRPVISD